MVVISVVTGICLYVLYLCYREPRWGVFQKLAE